MSPVPCFAAVSELYPGVVYAAEPAVHIPCNGAHVIVWLPEPTLGDDLAATYRWLESDLHIAGPHATLNDYARAELLFVAGGDPLVLDDAAALAAIGRALAEVGCDMVRCARRVSNALDRYPAEAGPLWRRCLERARLLAVT